MNDVETTDGSPKDTMLIIEPRTGNGRDKELRAIGAGAYEANEPSAAPRMINSPAFAIARVYGRSNCALDENSSSKFPPHIDSPPVPSPEMAHQRICL